MEPTLQTRAEPRHDHPEATHEDYAATLDGLTHAPDEEPKEIDIHTPAEEGIAHAWLQRFIPGIEKVAASYGLGNYVVTRGPGGTKVWESMPLYVRVGMQALYHGREQAKLLETKRVEELFKQQSIKQGIAFDSPVNALPHIQNFVKTYHIDTSALLEPDLTKYRTFNEFFSRKLKPGARPPASPEDPDVISSAADCRLTVFEDVDTAKKFWIKGKHFTIPSLLEDESLASQFENGALAVFRLAPADYHRFHSPVTAKVGATKSIEGTYYTVNPVCVNESSLDVFTQNKRDVTLLSVSRPDGSDVPVAYVQIGAMLVGGIARTVDEGSEVQRGDELGYFAYGGSTIIAVFPPGLVKFDADLLKNSEDKIETVVRAGEQIGRFV
ncbi:phosphatidylserine decarboxylase-domain-containing protein [Rhodotorula diobovata]|uniref:phosphatidylserine decarboxylase n=1 Tax=Rhodotorula diobovata TaxID=5288 RepID=A0A5C5FT47_9BASI|nr:phosphatidylserine decarboxylase-domain-containing protein [Rhodotorula diobovata]